MFCKWCGADLPNSAIKCTRCGKDVPAMSDCGGFYDLVPNAKRRTAEGPVSTPVSPKAVPVNVDPAKSDTSKKDVPVKGKKNGRKSSGLELLIICIGFIIVIALLLGMNSKIGKVLDSVANSDGRIVTIYEELQQIKNSIQGEENEEPTPPPTDGVVPADANIEEQDVKIEINVEHTDTGSSVKTTADLGDFEDVVVDQVSFDKENHSLAAVQIDLSSMKNCIKIEVENTLSKTGMRKGTISVAFDINESVFAKMSGDAELDWVYRINGETEWANLDKDVFTVLDDGATVTYNASELEKLIDEAEMVEFRVTYKRANINDGSLTIIVSGISVTKQILEAGSYTFD